MKKKSLISGVIMVFVFIASAGAYAGVTMLGTRVIYPAGAKEQALRFSNPDDHPNLIQVWVDDGKPNAGMESAEPHFLVMPPVFRMEPDSGQVVRLSYVGDGLPQDRESLFFLNFLQVPALQEGKLDDNQLVLTVRSRMKLFYRPQALSNDADAARAPDLLSFSLRKSAGGKNIVAHNRSGYHIVIQQVLIADGSRDQEIVRATMIPPFMEAAWSLPAAVNEGAALRAKLRIVNDFGADVVREYPVH